MKTNHEIYQELLTERKELAVKLSKLASFLGSEDILCLSEDHQDLLEQQFSYMSLYMEKLTKRCIILKDEKGGTMVKLPKEKRI